MRKRDFRIMRTCRGLTEGPVRGPVHPSPVPQPSDSSGNPLTPTDLLTSQPLPLPALRARARPGSSFAGSAVLGSWQWAWGGPP